MCTQAYYGCWGHVCPSENSASSASAILLFAEISDGVTKKNERRKIMEIPRHVLVVPSIYLYIYTDIYSYRYMFFISLRKLFSFLR